MSAVEFMRWMEYHEIEPFGSQAEDCRMSVIACCADQYRPRNARFADYREYLPWTESEPIPEQPITEQQAAVNRAAEAFNKCRKRKAG